MKLVSLTIQRGLGMRAGTEPRHPVGARYRCGLPFLEYTIAWRILPGIEWTLLSRYYGDDS